MPKRLLTLILLFILLALPVDARADIAPPAQPPGSDLQPNVDTTQVRMQAETVLLDVQPGATEKSLGLARVTADFTMHNLGQADEHMPVRFPIGASDGWSSVNEIHDLRVRVNGISVPTRRITGEDPYNSSSSVPWAEFDVNFPAGKDTAVEVQYTLQATGEYPFIWFKYILSTGAGWKDTIGSADIIVQLPYPANNQNLMIDTPDFSFGTTLGGSLEGNTVRWHYSDLEPTPQDNFEINLVMPSAWKQLLMEQANVAKNPNDGEAWGRLGKLCKQMAFSSRGKGFRAANTLDPGAAQLFQQSLQAYDKAVTLLPKDALWHAGYAELLGYHAYFEAFNGTDTRLEAVHSLQELQAALNLAPDNSQVQTIAEEIHYFFPEGLPQVNDQYEFAWLTATPMPPTPVASPTELAENLGASATPETAPTSTAQAVPTQTERTKPSSTPSTPLCGSALMVPLLMVGAALFRPKRRRTSD